jgi:hypothetical protein
MPRQIRGVSFGQVMFHILGQDLLQIGRQLFQNVRINFRRRGK